MNVNESIVLLVVGLSIILILEKLFPNHELPHSEGWNKRLLFIYLCIPLCMLIDGVAWRPVLEVWSLFHLDNELPAWLGGFIAYLCWSFFYYWWHRWCHANDILWRVIHQLHHSPKRIQALTAYFVHPLDYMTASLIGSLVVFTLLGMGLDEAMYLLSYSVILSFLIHSNLKPPKWVGYVLQTPDMHRVHHKVNHHQGNYGVLVIWDQLFGTYVIPEKSVEECGFTKGREHRFIDILLLRDVHKAKATPEAATSNSWSK